jgi:hypothetical protein
MEIWICNWVCCTKNLPYANSNIASETTRLEMTAGGLKQNSSVKAQVSRTHDCSSSQRLPHRCSMRAVMEQLDSMFRDRRFLAARQVILAGASKEKASLLAALDALQYNTCQPLQALGLEASSALTVQNIHKAYRCLNAATDCSLLL